MWSTRGLSGSSYTGVFEAYSLGILLMLQYVDEGFAF